ncbi:hypothetical protein [Sphingomonas flavescens]|uniref:hypothetical protein n=1 Tax=Sphingomonas flavescens TaxID=3132797 RepID=UPI002805E157|nr:hypothetical protein [Sphingomonas limnosediminicola]
MKVELMQVGAPQSLEMDRDGLQAVRAYLKQTYPDLKTRTSGIVTFVSFAGSEFIFENEWDEPYLLAATAEGDDLLRGVQNRFS